MVTILEIKVFTFFPLYAIFRYILCHIVIIFTYFQPPVNISCHSVKYRILYSFSPLHSPYEVITADRSYYLYAGENAKVNFSVKAINDEGLESSYVNKIVQTDQIGGLLKLHIFLFLLILYYLIWFLG